MSDFLSDGSPSTDIMNEISIQAFSNLPKDPCVWSKNAFLTPSFRNYSCYHQWRTDFLNQMAAVYSEKREKHEQERNKKWVIIMTDRIISQIMEWTCESFIHRKITNVKEEFKELKWENLKITQKVNLISHFLHCSRAWGLSISVKQSNSRPRTCKSSCNLSWVPIIAGPQLFCLCYCANSHSVHWNHVKHWPSINTLLNIPQVTWHGNHRTLVAGSNNIHHATHINATPIPTGSGMKP